ncbi:hypothetical protein [Vibrio diabolicus]
MLAKSTSTIYFMLSVLTAFALSSGITRAEIPSTTSYITVGESLHISCCDLDFSSVKTDEPGCCEPGGVCFEKQCCSHGHASGNAVLETQLRSYEGPYKDERVVSQTTLYISADMHSHYRPPIA